MTILQSAPQIDSLSPLACSPDAEMQSQLIRHSWVFSRAWLARRPPTRRAVVAALFGLRPRPPPGRPLRSLRRKLTQTLPQCGQVVVRAENLGDLPVTGSTTPVSITDVLPPGVRAVGIARTLTSSGDAGRFGTRRSRSDRVRADFARDRVSGGRRDVYLV